MSRYFSGAPKSGGPAKNGKKVETLGEMEDKQNREQSEKEGRVGFWFPSTKTKLQADAKKRTSDPDYKKPQAETLTKGPAKTSDGPAKTKGERQKGRADKKAARQQVRAKKRIDRNEGKQARIKKNTQSSSDPAVRASGKARIERAKKRVKKNKTVSPDYVSKKDKANIAKNKKNKPGLKNPPPSSKQETPLSAADKGDDFDKFLSPAKKTKRKGLLRRANKEIARKNTDSKKVQRLVEKYVEKNK